MRLRHKEKLDRVICGVLFMDGISEPISPGQYDRLKAICGSDLEVIKDEPCPKCLEYQKEIEKLKKKLK